MTITDGKGQVRESPYFSAMATDGGRIAYWDYAVCSDGNPRTRLYVNMSAEEIAAYEPPRTPVVVTMTHEQARLAYSVLITYSDRMRQVAAEPPSLAIHPNVYRQWAREAEALAGMIEDRMWGVAPSC